MFQFKGYQAGRLMLHMKSKGRQLQNSPAREGLFVLFCPSQEEIHPHL